MKSKSNCQRSKPRSNHGPNSHDFSRNCYQAARADINFVRDRVKELTQLGRGTKGVEDAIQQSHISSTLEYATRDFDSARRMQDFASDLMDKLFKLEQDIVCKNNRKVWEKDLRLIFVYEATTLAEYAKRLDEAILCASHDELVLTRNGATTHYILGRDGLDACLTDVLHYENEDAIRHERTDKVFDEESFTSYIAANTRAKHLIARERFAEMARSAPIAVTQGAPNTSKRKKKRRKK